MKTTLYKNKNEVIEQVNGVLRSYGLYDLEKKLQETFSHYHDVSVEAQSP